MLISLENVGRSFGAEQIFAGVTCRIEDRDRIGLVGINGAGKTTLLSLICGEAEPDAGEITRGAALSIGYLRQNSGLRQGGTIIGEMRAVFADVYAALAEMRALSDEMAACGDESRLKPLSERYRRAEDVVLARDGYQLDVKINTVLNGMGFAAHGYEKRIDQLSGGEQTRLAIARLLLEAPSLLILDEPTNHLDFQTLTWLEDYLSRWKGALLVVSHDRYFLDKVCSSVWEMEDGELTAYRGNYTRYRELREESDSRQRRLFEQQKAEIAKLEDYVAKNLVRASTTKMAQSRRKAAEKAKEELTAPRRRLRPPKLRLRTAPDPVSEVLKAEGLTFAVGEGEKRRVLLENAEFTVRRGDRVAIIGANGTGKTTLIKCLLGQHPYTGDIVWGRGVRSSYYDQGCEALDVNMTVLETLRESYPAAAETTLRTTLGAMGLTGDDAFKLVSQLSGGERARLKLAVICLAESNLLILDEPTNHLDLATKDALEAALADYPGTILMVSHDRYLLDQVPTRIFALENDGLTVVKGRYADYLALAAQRVPEPEPEKEQKAVSDAAQQHYRSKQERRDEAKRRADLARTEALIAALEAEGERLQGEIAAQGDNYEALQTLCAAAQENEKALADAMERWVALSE